MTCTRRTFLATSTAALVSGPVVSAASSGVAFLVLQDIPTTWKRDEFDLILANLRKNELPVLLVMADSIGQVIEDRVAARLFAGSINSDLLEAVSVAPLVLHRQRYWHLRAAHDFRRALVEPAAADFVPSKFPQPITYFESREDPGTDLSAYRSAGFRVRIVAPEADSQAEVVVTGRDQLSISGGQLLDLFDPALDRALAALPKGKEFTVLHLSLAKGAFLSGEVLARAADTSASLISAALFRLGSYASLARDYFLSGGPYVPRDIALLLDGADADGTLASFATDLGKLDLPFSQMTGASGPGDCAEALSSAAVPLEDCLTVFDVRPGDAAAATVIVGSTEVNGLGPDARMHFNVLDFSASERLDRLTLADSDRVMRITARDVANPLARARLARRLADGQSQGQIRLHSVPGLRDRVMASDPVLQRYWSLRRRRLSDPAVSSPPDAAEHARLMEDAALAWSYFDRHTFVDTGLTAGTVSAAPGGRVNSEVTLWDVGSQINAIIAAAELGLIGGVVASDMIRKAVAALPTDVLDGTRLPPSNFSAQTLETTVEGFDSCDTGRLGIALGRAVAKGLVEKAEMMEILKTWQLETAVRDGAHYSHRSGRWQNTSQSHCTNYIVSGFAFFDQTVHPLQSQVSDSADAQIATLYQTASLGAIATEPFALQAIEQEMDGQTHPILDALFDAQLGWFEATGLLRAVSETPIDREPWFLYSGVRLDIEGPEAWVVGTISDPTASPGSASSIVSSKAAYLWKAVHPHAYSDLLVDTIRQNARIPGHGFSVGVYSDTLLPVPNYTVINTNGIILSAIARILAPRQARKG